jgi:hypothetical protein
MIIFEYQNKTMNKILLVTILACLFPGCHLMDDCKGKDCFTPPPQFLFELTDKYTGENLFTNGSLDMLEITVVDEDNEIVNHTFITENGLNIIDVSIIGWNTGFKKYTISAGPDLNIGIHLNMEELHENCCTFFRTIEFSVENFDYEQSITTGIIKVMIE